MLTFEDDGRIMFSLSLVLTLMFLNSSLLISADDDCYRSADITACEGFVLQLSCPDHHKIKILAANYGRTERRTCRYKQRLGNLRDTHCYLPNSVFIVARSCNGNRRCFVPATNTKFSDQCPGTYKYLRVKYCCKRHRS